jgi:hypothetical protein
MSVEALKAEVKRGVGFAAMSRLRARRGPPDRPVLTQKRPTDSFKPQVAGVVAAKTKSHVCDSAADCGHFSRSYAGLRCSLVQQK